MQLEPITMSGEKSASAAICNNSSTLYAVDLLPPTTGTAVLKIYDNPSAASGTIIFECQVSAGTSSTSVIAAVARYARTGLYAALTDTSGTALFNVGYQRENG